MEPDGTSRRVKARNPTATTDEFDKNTFARSVAAE
jgi:hypothetical protein